jgi:hypothetical protein
MRLDDVRTVAPTGLILRPLERSPDPVPRLDARAIGANQDSGVLTPSGQPVEFDGVVDVY